MSQNKNLPFDSLWWPQGPVRVQSSHNCFHNQVKSEICFVVFKAERPSNRLQHRFERKTWALYFSILHLHTQQGESKVPLHWLLKVIPQNVRSWRSTFGKKPKYTTTTEHHRLGSDCRKVLGGAVGSRPLNHCAAVEPLSCKQEESVLWQAVPEHECVSLLNLNHLSFEIFVCIR